MLGGVLEAVLQEADKEVQQPRRPHGHRGEQQVRPEPRPVHRQGRSPVALGDRSLRSAGLNASRRIPGAASRVGAQQRTPGKRNAPKAPRGRPRGPHRRRLPRQLVLHEVSGCKQNARFGLAPGKLLFAIFLIHTTMHWVVWYPCVAVHGGNIRV